MACSRPRIRVELIPLDRVSLVDDVEGLSRSSLSRDCQLPKPEVFVDDVVEALFGEKLRVGLRFREIVRSGERLERFDSLNVSFLDFLSGDLDLLRSDFSGGVGLKS